MGLEQGSRHGSHPWIFDKRAVLFSVVIPTFNRKSLLEQTLRSVFEQTDQDFEILVVDDGSTDGTAAFVESLPEPVTLLRQQNRGPGAARNLGLSVAKGDYVAFLDSDDIWFPWALATYRTVIENSDRPALIVAATAFFDSLSELERIPPEPISLQLFTDFYAASRVPLWHGASAIVVNAAQARAVGGFTAEWINAEDTDFLLRMGVAPRFANMHSPCTVGYREHCSSAVADFHRTVAGLSRLIGNEKGGAYPGGQPRQRERRRIISAHVRPATFECLRQRLYRDAWRLYTSTFSWNLRLWKLRYLTGFILCAAVPGLAQRLPKPVSEQRRAPR